MSEAKEREPGTLSTSEYFWRDHQKWLESCGYMLRPRYSPDWVPSWKLPGSTEKDFGECEDGHGLMYSTINDGTRMSDGTFVTFKSIRKSVHPYEAEIGRFFSSEPLASDLRNHCIPFYDVLHVPDDENTIILVMPLLRRYDDPRFETFGEAVEYFRQVFEGLQFMHEHNVAHRDCMGLNILMDATPLYPEPFHPRKIKMKRDFTGKAQHSTRTQNPPKYYLIDFGISRRYRAEDCPPLEYPILGGDKSVPEFHHSDEPCNPFPTDVYYAGNMIRRGFFQKMHGFQFMKPLVADMVQDDPSKRPTMAEVVSRFETLRNSLSSWKLRSRIAKRDEWFIFSPFRSAAHWRKHIPFILKGIPAVPTPSS